MKRITISDLMHLGTTERIQLVQDLWDSIAAETADTPDRLPITEAQRQEIARRSEAHRRNPGEAIPLDEALDRIDRSL